MVSSLVEAKSPATLADLEAEVLTVSRLAFGRWLELGTFSPGEVVRTEPFDDVEIDIAPWWEGVAPAGAE